MLLLLIPLFGLRVIAQFSRRKSLAGLIAPRLHHQLVRRTRQAQQWASFVLLILGLAAIIVALARPQYGFEEVTSYSEGRSIIIALDTSRSMLANDLVPNRLERAKLAARDIVDLMGEDRIGLMAFAGKAFLQAPLTTDHLAVVESIEQVDTELIPRGGTNLTAAARLALDTFRESNSRQNALVLFSDGEALEGQGQVEQIREEADREGMMIISIGVGTQQGSIIPEPGPDGRPLDGVFVRGPDGQVVRSRLDPVALQGLATGGGIYIQLGDRGSLTRVVSAIEANLTAIRSEDEKKQRPIERFMWPLGIGFLLLVLSHVVHLLFLPLDNRLRSRAPVRAVPTTAIGLLLLGAGVARGGDDGWSYLRKENFLSAIKQFEETLSRGKLPARKETDIHLGIGSASYRMGDYEKASESYGKALVHANRHTREQAHYNLGNTLYRRGETYLNSGDVGPDAPVAMTPDSGEIEATLRQWVGALEHYEAALRINRRNERARHNIEIIKKKIEELEAQEPPEENQENQPQNEEPEEPEQGEDEPNEEEPNEEERSGDQEESDSESGDQSEQPESDQGESEPGESPPDESGEDGESGENETEPARPDDSSPESNENPSEPVDAPPDPGEGEISAESAGQSPGDSSESLQEEINPDTGYAPTEARQLIEALADEDGDLRPVYPMPQITERYKNW